jgi:hypothetical protein
MVFPIIATGIAVPAFTSWLGGEIRFTKSRDGEPRITEESLRRIALGAIAGIAVALISINISGGTLAVQATTPVQEESTIPEFPEFSNGVVVD